MLESARGGRGGADGRFGALSLGYCRFVRLFSCCLDFYSPMLHLDAARWEAEMVGEIAAGMGGWSASMFAFFSLFIPLLLFY